MRKTLAACLLALLFSGCQQYKKLTNSDNDKNEYNEATIQGNWGGNQVDVAGLTEHFHFLIGTQNGPTFSGLFFGDASGFSGNVTGSISANVFSMTLDEGTQCTNKFTATGFLANSQMTVTITGAGNNIPGSSCYPSAISKTVVLDR